MKKIICGMFAVGILIPLLSVGVYAKAPDTASIEAVIISPSLSFTGNTANCGVVVYADKSSDSISATMKLWRGSTLIAIWSDSSNSQLVISKFKEVTSGYTYKVTVNVSINGVAQPTKSISRYH